MPKRSDIKKVLVIGSGPIVIGQAAEFDYAGAQACRVLKNEGINVVLCNSNPATIMTDRALADEIYLEPLTEESLKRIILKEKPDSLLASLAPSRKGIHSAAESTLCASISRPWCIGPRSWLPMTRRTRFFFPPMLSVPFTRWTAIFLTTR